MKKLQMTERLLNRMKVSAEQELKSLDQSTLTEEQKASKVSYYTSLIVQLTLCLEEVNEAQAKLS
ncbi:MAG: hypothetical protein PHF05_00220 [Candidatus Izemoplasmatales bacterium]|nr:hypothetical protein [Candidatus Izemoplasmatales bacterium]